MRNSKKLFSEKQKKDAKQVRITWHPIYNSSKITLIERLLTDEVLV